MNITLEVLRIKIRHFIKINIILGKLAENKQDIVEYVYYQGSIAALTLVLEDLEKID